MGAATPPLSGPPKPQAKALNCPKCGAAITLHSFGQAVTVVCASCHCVLDAKDPTLPFFSHSKPPPAVPNPSFPLASAASRAAPASKLLGSHRAATPSIGST